MRAADSGSSHEFSEYLLPEQIPVAGDLNLMTRTADGHEEVEHVSRSSFSKGSSAVSGTCLEPVSGSESTSAKYRIVTRLRPTRRSNKHLTHLGRTHTTRVVGRCTGPRICGGAPVVAGRIADVWLHILGRIAVPDAVIILRPLAHILNRRMLDPLK